MELQTDNDRLCLAGTAPSITFKHGSETKVSDVDGIFDSSRRSTGLIMRSVRHYRQAMRKVYADRSNGNRVTVLCHCLGQDTSVDGTVSPH